MARADSSFRRSSGLPAYRVRLSDRARRLQLKVSPLGQVEVVVPRGTDPEVASTFVGRHRQWLERTLARLGRNTDDPELTAPLPTRIDLRALGTRRAVLYETAAGGEAPAVSAWPEGHLAVRAPDAFSARAGLREWLTGEARARLVPWLERVSAETGLVYERARVRAQKTRWGSCSPRRHISINRNLLFLPEAVVRYLFVHELCHTVHLDHSRRYWELVERMEPGYRALDAELRASEHLVPLWAYPEG